MHSLQVFISQQSKRLGKYSKTCVHNEGHLYQRQAIWPGKRAIVLCWTSSHGAKPEHYVDWWKQFDSKDSLSSFKAIVLSSGFSNSFLNIFEEILDRHSQVTDLPSKSWGISDHHGDFTKTKCKYSYRDNRSLSTPFVVCKSLFPTHLIIDLPH